MKKLLLMLLMPLAMMTAQAQSNDYNMVIELNNGTKITLGDNDVENLTFNGDALSISGSTIADLYSQIARLEVLFSQLRDKVSPGKTFTVNGVSFRMVKVAGGTFQMGATSEQGDDASDSEKPVHNVTLYDYYIGETEVTQELWYAVMGKRPTSDGDQWSSSWGLGDNYPAYNVSWNDCQTFITRLNQLTGQQFRLPTEAEWEFAARGGKNSLGYKYAGSNTIGDVAWYLDNIPSHSYGTAGYGTQPVANKSPNELGLYDMSGNVREWCQDWYGSYSYPDQTNPIGPSSGSYRVTRGGAWGGYARDCRVSQRANSHPNGYSERLGLRLAF
ncbi:MAG: SUMF1/EgtB/PvdO family nonheme iron enzyme [Prevotella sp.]|nr:SUMF1/EgtB/PvdO family nonheme iron enzyme [Prevotella sp.]